LGLQAGSSAPVTLGRLGRVHGLAGWLNLESFCEPPEHIFEHPLWLIGQVGRPVAETRWAERRRDGVRWRVRLHGVESVEAAAPWVGATVAVMREALPALPRGEYYRADLLGFEVVNLEGQSLGRLDHFVDAPANAVLVAVEPGVGARAGRERWIPLTPQHFRRVDPLVRRVEVDWPKDF
jgi:16S rRNA processing protein RimM